jgi:2-dehydropantoate 2-reductase
VKLAIIGGGSIGLLFAYYLSDEHDVTLYTRTKHQSKAITENGIQLKAKGSTYKRDVHSNPIECWEGKEELTFIAVKQYHLKQILNEIVLRDSLDSKFIFLQNGMGHLKLLEKFISSSIYVCTVEHGAYKENAFTVSHNGIGLTRMALFKGKESLPPTIFSIHNFPIMLEEDYYQMLVRKLVINSVINPLTSLLRITNGQIINNMFYFEAAKGLFLEVADVLDLKNRDSCFQQVIEVCEKTAENRSSMLKDLEQENQTEIDAIIGYILEEADKKKKNAPICQLLFNLIKGSEVGRSKYG